LIDPRNLPSHKVIGRSVDWIGYTIGAAVVATVTTLLIAKLLPQIPAGIDLVIFGVLMVPVLVCFGIAMRHLMVAARMRRAEMQEGLITYPNALLRFMDEHPYVFALIVTAGALLVVLIWTLLEHR